MSKIRLGIVGGKFGAEHAAAFAKVDGIDLVAICDRDKGTHSGLIEAHGVSAAYESYGELFAAGNLDAVVVALPPRFHERAVTDAFDAGLHVLCENPPALNASEMSRIVSAAGLCGKTYMWSRPQRFAAGHREARRLVEGDELGQVYRAEGKWHLGWSSFTDGNWRANSEQGGGALLNQSLHVIDSLWFAMGCPDPVEAVAASHDLFLRERAEDPGEAADDSAFGTLRFKNGASLGFSSMLFAHIDGKAKSGEAPETLELAVYGTKASLDLVRGRQTRARQAEISSGSYADELSSPDLLVAQAQEFADAIREQREPLNSGKEGLTLMKMLDALAESAKEKRAISIKSVRSLEDLFGGL